MEARELIQQEKSLKKAKLNLMTMPNTVFFTTILFSLKQEFTTKVPTAAVDGVNLYINPFFWKGLNPDTQIGLLLHEIMHVALDHLTRVGERNPSIWNVAGDHVINLLLYESNYKLPEGALRDNQFKGLTTEEVYKRVFEEEENKNGGPLGKTFVVTSSNGNGLQPNDVLSPKGKQENKKVKDQITDIVLRAATQAQVAGAPGSIPGEVAVQIQERINPKLPWNVILQNYLTEFAKDDYSLRRPNKKFLPFYLPSLYSEAIPNLSIAVDCSGSVSDAEFSHFIREIDKIKETLNPKKISVVSFDTKISKVVTLSESESIFKNIKFVGRGGTRIGPVMKWAEDHLPDLMIIFTDGYFSPVKIKKNVPVIWIIHNNSGFTSEFGKIIHYDIDRN